MAVIERKWIGVGTGALGALAFDDEATALQYVQDCGGSWPVVEYVPASQLAGAVEERDRLLRRALGALGGEGRTSRHLVARQIEAFLDQSGGQ